MAAPKKTRLGWLGPAIVILGVVAAALGTWFMIVSKPKAGAVIDTLAIDQAHALVVRAEDGGNRNFVELRAGDRVMWQSIVPTYAGRPGAPGIAWNNLAVTVRVIRDGRAEIFAIARANGSKLGGFKLAPTQRGPVVKQDRGPVTLTDHVRSYEIIAGADWHEIVAIDLASGQPRWRQDLGAGLIEAGGIENGRIWLVQQGNRREFAGDTGKETTRL
jgi:outer membrane protein assembly factor BamB